MKKLFISALAVGALCLSSCGNKTNKAENATDSLTEVTLGEANDSVSELSSLANTLQEQLKNKDIQGLQNTLSSLQDKYQELLKSGKVEEAKEYAKKVKEFVDANGDKIKECAKDNKTISTLVDQVKGLSLGAESDVKAPSPAPSPEPAPYPAAAESPSSLISSGTASPSSLTL